MISSIPTDGTRAQFASILPPLPEVEDKTIARLHFESLAELVALIPDKAPNAAESKYWTNTDKDFFGCSMAEAKHFARDGWEEGANRARVLMERVQLARPVKKKLARYDVAGAVACVPRYLSGNPRAMLNRAPAISNQSPILTIVASSAASWDLTPATFEYFSCAAAALVDRLEDAGFRVEVIAGRRESNSPTGQDTGENNAIGHRCDMMFRLKSSHDHLDLSRLAFGMGHPAVLRRLLFAACSMHPAYHPVVVPSQGFSVALDKIERPTGTYILPNIRSLKNLKDPVAVFDRCMEALKAQGCPGLE